MKALSRKFALVLFGLFAFVFAACAQVTAADADDANASASQPSVEILQLVAPIALYPDALVAQILTAATYPVQVVEAGRWLQQNSVLTGQALADAVNAQPWDTSVKALTQFPAVLQNMNENLTWTSSLGDAYVNQPDQIANAVQILRQRAEAAGTLTSNADQVVTTQDQAINIEPVDQDVVYVPAYDPWLVYGDPIVAYPNWAAVPGIFYAGPDVFFDTGLAVGAFAAFDFGFHRFDFDFHRHAAMHDHVPFFSHSPTFAHRNGGRPVFGPGPVRIDRPPSFSAADGRGHSPTMSPIGHAQLPAVPGSRTGAFTGFDHGGVVNGYAARGRSSFADPAHVAAPMHAEAPHEFAGGFHGGDGGFHGGDGGGFHGGGGGHH